MKSGYIALIVMVLLAGSCSRQESSPGQGKAGLRAPVPVLVARVETRDVPVELRAIGSVQAYSMVSLRSQITAPITEVNFQEGRDVKAGDLLFTLDARPGEAALNQARANLNRDAAQMLSARLQFLRTSNLFEGKIASQSDYDVAEASYRALEATVAADAAAATNAEVYLGYTAIRSPIDGRTGNLTVKTGNVVKSPDDVLLTITQVRPIYVAFFVPEQQLPAIQREAGAGALRVEAFVSGAADHPERGELTFINNTVDTNSGTILLKATFPNTNSTLWPGQFVQASLTISNIIQATVVPAQAVQTGQNGDFIFAVMPDQTVETRAVMTGITREGMTVIFSGVKPGDVVVTDGQLRLVPGAKVSVKDSLTSGAVTNAEAARP